MRHDLNGKIFGRLTVVGYLGSELKGNRKKAFWQCACECGNLTKVEASNLKNGHTRSCGCLTAELTAKRSFKHGLTRTVEFTAWVHAKGRCYNKNDIKYPAYGARGIKMCHKWRNDFLSFLKDMGPKPKGMSLERIDVNGNYEPSNCKWATSLDQANNKQFHRFVVFNGFKMTLAQCARINGKKYKQLHFHFHAKGHPIEKALALTANLSSLQIQCS